LDTTSANFKKSINSERLLPTFLIIGAQKSGTTTLFEIMTKHPNFVRPTVKEINYFGWRFWRGLTWYKNHFPIVSDTPNVITGEATTNYIWHPLAAQRIKKILPHIKIIIILRNPIDRAYSHFHMSLKQGREWLAFEDAINIEEERLRGKKEAIVKGQIYDSFDYKFHSYLSRGKYVYQIKDWIKYFPTDRFLILRTEDLASEAENTYNKIFRFLDLPSLRIDFDNQRIRNYPKMNSDTRKKLIEYFKPYNEELYKFLNMDFDWDK